MNRLADNGGKQDEERCGRFWELPGQGEQSCFELFVICLRDTELTARQERITVVMQGAKEQKQRQKRTFVAFVDRR